MTTLTDYRALCAELIQLDQEQPTEYSDWKKRWSAAINRTRALLSRPEPETAGVSNEEWEAIKDRLWQHYETTGYQGERFIYESDFDTALDVARQELTRPQPVAVSERLPGPENCTTDKECWYWDSISGCWFFLPGPPLNDHYTHWLPHNALPVPGAEVW